jgi:hypothetical protein
MRAGLEELLCPLVDIFNLIRKSTKICDLKNRPIIKPIYLFEKIMTKPVNSRVFVSALFCPSNNPHPLFALFPFGGE